MSKRDELDRERYLIDMHLLCKLQSDKLLIQAKRLANLSEFYKEAGYYTDAVCEIKRALRISGDNDYEAVLTELEKEIGLSDKRCPYCFVNNYSQNANNFCPECKRMITVCSKCDAPNRLFDPYCRYCGLEFPKSSNTGVRIGNFVLDWFHPFIFENLSPQPMMAGDLVVIPIINDRSLMALKIFNGEVEWKLEDMFASDVQPGLTFCYPYLYVYSTKRISRIIPELAELNPATIYADPDSFIYYSSFPSIDKHTHSSLFPVNKGMLFHDIWRKRGELLQIDIEKNDALFPIVIGSDKLIFSKNGEVYKLYSNKNEFYHYYSIPKCEIVGPPVSPIGSNQVYFESFFQGKRTINIWSPKTKNILSKTLSDTFCSIEDIHFNNPPLLYKDGILLTSCQEPRLYYVKVIEGDIDLKEIPIEISVGVRKVLNIESLFSVVVGPYFISRMSDWFLLHQSWRYRRQRYGVFWG